jgi:hypothetical protein
MLFSVGKLDAILLGNQWPTGFFEYSRLEMNAFVGEPELRSKGWKP